MIAAHVENLMEEEEREEEEKEWIKKINSGKEDELEKRRD